MSFTTCPNSDTVSVRMSRVRMRSLCAANARHNAIPSTRAIASVVCMLTSNGYVPPRSRRLARNAAASSVCWRCPIWIYLQKNGVEWIMLQRCVQTRTRFTLLLCQQISTRSSVGRSISLSEEDEESIAANDESGTPNDSWFLKTPQV